MKENFEYIRATYVLLKSLENTQNFPSYPQESPYAGVRFPLAQKRLAIEIYLMKDSTGK